MAVNLLAYNKRKDIHSYNCGGFALKSRDWYIPDSWRYHHKIEDEASIDELFEDCVQDILRDFPELVRVDDHMDVPNKKDVIGFRFAVTYPGDTLTCDCGADDCECDYESEDLEIDDFHFILRRHGEWFHKPGSRLIDKLSVLPDEAWPRTYCDYNGEIAWFTYR